LASKETICRVQGDNRKGEEVQVQKFSSKCLHDEASGNQRAERETGKQLLKRGRDGAYQARFKRKAASMEEAKTLPPQRVTSSIAPVGVRVPSGKKDLKIMKRTTARLVSNTHPRKKLKREGALGRKQETEEEI